MHILKELWTEDVDTPVVKTSYQFVFERRERLGQSSRKPKARGKSIMRKSGKFHQREKVLLLPPTDHNNLLIKWIGPNQVDSVVSLKDNRVKIG